MAIVSTFELLVKPQLPTENQLPSGLPVNLLSKIDQLRRNAIQGYFLTLSNLSNRNIELSLVFTVSNTTNIEKVVGFLDTSVSNDTLDVPTIVGNKIRFSPVSLAASDTALFLLQPNFLTSPELLVNPDLEIRGYVEVFLSSLSGNTKNVQLQVTPEHRGTFYKFNEEDPDTLFSLDQYAYALPIQNGGFLRLSPSGAAA
jgi:hypothetical protein